MRTDHSSLPSSHQVQTPAKAVTRVREKSDRDDVSAENRPTLHADIEVGTSQNSVNGSVEEHMRMAARMLYDIIRAWRQRQTGEKAENKVDHAESMEGSDP